MVLSSNILSLAKSKDKEDKKWFVGPKVWVKMRGSSIAKFVAHDKLLGRPLNF